MRQILDDVDRDGLVGDETAGKKIRVRQKRPVEFHEVILRQPDLVPKLEVVGAIHDRRVHDAGTVGRRHEVGGRDVPRFFVLLGPLDRVADVRVQRLVFHADERGAVDLLDDLGFRSDDGQAVLRAPKKLLGNLHFHISNLLPDGKRDVARQRPRRGRPRDEELVVLSDDLELRVYRDVLHVLISLRQFVRRQTGPAARAVRGDAIVLVQQAAVPDLLDDPPERLDVLRLVGHVRVVDVHPVPDALGELLPLGEIRPHGLLALRVELPDPKLLDLCLSREPELLFNLKLNRQPVRVPASFTIDMESAHRLVPRNQVLERTGFHMVDARTPVGRRRPLVKNKIAHRSRLFQGFLEDCILLPIFQYLLFPLGKRKPFVGHNV